MWPLLLEQYDLDLPYTHIFTFFYYDCMQMLSSNVDNISTIFIGTIYRIYSVQKPVFCNFLHVLNSTTFRQ